MQILVMLMGIKEAIRDEEGGIIRSNWPVPARFALANNICAKQDLASAAGDEAIDGRVDGACSYALRNTCRASIEKL